MLKMTQIYQKHIFFILFCILKMFRKTRGQNWVMTVVPLFIMLTIKGLLKDFI
jgi:hypothetical protein